MTPTAIDPVQPVGIPQYPREKLQPSYIQRWDNADVYAAATGKTAPWDPNHPEKYWVDNRTFPADQQYVSYTALQLDATDQHAIQITMMLPVFMAGEVNMRPAQGTSEPPKLPAYTVPSRALLPNELPITGFGGVIEIINTDLMQPPGVPDGAFTQADRIMLQRTFSFGKRLAGHFKV